MLMKFRTIVTRGVGDFVCKKKIKMQQQHNHQFPVDDEESTKEVNVLARAERKASSVVPSWSSLSMSHLNATPQQSLSFNNVALAAPVRALAFEPYLQRRVSQFLYVGAYSTPTTFEDLIMQLINCFVIGLLIGTGSQLSVYCVMTGRLVWSNSNVFNNSTIWSIKICAHMLAQFIVIAPVLLVPLLFFTLLCFLIYHGLLFTTIADGTGRDRRILIFGQKRVCVLSHHKQATGDGKIPTKEECTNNRTDSSNVGSDFPPLYVNWMMDFKDWIWHVLPLTSARVLPFLRNDQQQTKHQESEDSNFGNYIAIGYAHNFVEVWEWKTATLVHTVKSEPCILYPVLNFTLLLYSKSVVLHATGRSLLNDWLPDIALLSTTTTTAVDAS